LLLIADPGNDRVLMYTEQPQPGSVTFEVFAVDGSLLASRTVDKGVKASWAWNTGGAHGRVVLVRATSRAGATVRRIVLP
jgi:hypothetical protein